MAFPVVQSTNTSESASGQSHVVTLPAGIVSGDLLLVQWGSGASNPGTVTFPAGWTVFFNITHPDFFQRFVVARRVADGGEGASITVTSQFDSRSTHISYRISGAGTAEASTGVSGNSNFPDSDSLTPTGGADDYLWLTAFNQRNAASVFLFPTSYTGGLSIATSVQDGLSGSAQRNLNAVSENPGQFQTTGGLNWLTGTFAVVPSPSAVLSGTITDDSELDIRAGGSTIVLTLTNTTWEANVGADNPQTQALIDGLDSAQAEAAGWDAVVKAGLTFSDVARTSDTVVTITLPAFPSYNIGADEEITVTVPASALDFPNALVASPTFTILAAGAGAAAAVTFAQRWLLLG